MSSESVLDALLVPSIERGQADAPVIQMYLRHLLELDRKSIYTYLYENSTAIEDCLPKPLDKGHFILDAWRLAPPEHWEEWGEEMPRKYKGAELADAVTSVLDHLLGVAATLEPAATRSVIAHLAGLEPALRAMSPEQVGKVATTARTVLGRREWWVDEETSAGQIALHELLRAIEEWMPRAQEHQREALGPLNEARFEDITRAPLQSAAELRTMIDLALDISRESYSELWSQLPKASIEEQPALFAERLLARVVLEQREGAPFSSNLVAEYMKELRALRKLGSEYLAQVRKVATTIIDLHPRPFQLDQLSRYLGSQPPEDALAALRRWARHAERKDRADAIARMVRPLFDATAWVEVLSQFEYPEAPVLRALSEALLERGTKLRHRKQMAKMVRSLRLRTQSNRDKLAELIAQLLSPKQPKGDLAVALVLCEGLGPEHQKQVRLQRAFIAYSKRNRHKYTPAELPAIAASGVTIPDKYLSKNARKRGEELIAEGVHRVRQLGKFVGLGSGP